LSIEGDEQYFSTLLFDRKWASVMLFASFMEECTGNPPTAGAVSAIILGAQVPVAGKLTGRESGAFCK
jgi:hypothetical protein